MDFKKHAPDVDRDRDPDEPKREGNALAPAPTGSVFASSVSVPAIEAMFKTVDMASISSRSGKPMMLYKSRDNTWAYGVKGNVPEENSPWAANPVSGKWGWICFDLNNSNKATDHMVPISQPMPDVRTLPNIGLEWKKQMTVDMKCMGGLDADIEVTYKASTDGGCEALGLLFQTIQDRVNGGKHDDKLVPILHLGSWWYPHKTYGRIWKPLLTIIDWVRFDDPSPVSEPASPSPAPATPAAEQPRRRRVA
jgi:hypothetical protein